MSVPHGQDTPSALSQLQAWYLAHCDGDWEHQSGIDIRSLDNPGWTLRVELAGIPLADAPFAGLKENGEDAGEWIICDKRGTTFVGSGGPLELERLISIFLEWASPERHA